MKRFTEKLGGENVALELMENALALALTDFTNDPLDCEKSTRYQNLFQESFVLRRTIEVAPNFETFTDQVAIPIKLLLAWIQDLTLEALFFPNNELDTIIVRSLKMIEKAAKSTLTLEDRKIVLENSEEDKGLASTGSLYGATRKFLVRPSEETLAELNICIKDVGKSALWEQIHKDSQMSKGM